MFNLGARSSRRRRWALSPVLAVTAVVTLLLGLAGPAGAGLLPPDYSLIVRSTDGYSKGVCEFTVTSVDYDAGVVRGRMRAEVRPSRFRAYLSNAHLREVCTLRDPQGNVVGRLVVDADGTRAATRDGVVVPQHSHYTLCSVVETTLKSGTQHTSPLVCTS